MYLQVVDIIVKLPRDKKLRYLKPLYNGYNVALHGGGIDRGQVATQNIPVVPSCRHLKSGNFRAVMLVGLHSEAQWLFVEERHATTMEN